RKIAAGDLLNLEPKSQDVQVLFKAVLKLNKENKSITTQTILDEIATPKKPNDPEHARILERSKELVALPPQNTQTIKAHTERIGERTAAITGRLNLWAGIASVMFNL